MRLLFRHLFFNLPVSLFLILVIFFILLWVIDSLYVRITPPVKIEYGVTFSILQTERLGYDPETVYATLLTDLRVKRIRLPVYWNTVESSPGHFDFTAYDRLLDLSTNHQTQVILTLGYKAPRWPECFAPSWTSQEQLQPETLNFLKTAVNHFKNRPEIVAWQVENEPLFPFGNCQIIDKAFLQQEVSTVRALDGRPIILTDSGEFGRWIQTINYADIFGTTLYRTAWNPWTGYVRYPFPPIYYQLKAQLIKPKEVFVSELQAEPWEPGTTVTQTPINQQVQVFGLKNFQTEIKFASQTGISKQYLWGVEWWYFMKEHGHPEYWNFAKTLF